MSNIKFILGDNEIDLSTLRAGIYTLHKVKHKWVDYAFPGYRKVPQERTKGPYLIKEEAEQIMSEWIFDIQGKKSEFHIESFKAEVFYNEKGKKDVRDPEIKPLEVTM